MSDDPNINFPNIGGVQIQIGNLNLYPREANFENETIAFNSVVIQEDMFAESIFGTIEFIDSTENLALTNQINIDDTVTISFDGNSYNFQVSDINIATDLASKKLIGPKSHPTKVIVRFASYSFLVSNFITSFNEDFIGKISINDNAAEEEPQSYLEGIDLPLASDALPDFEPLTGFVQTQILPYLTKPLIADSTFNDIWYKHEPIHYPYSKIGSSNRISQIMNYVCEYACDLYNKDAVNFFFWEDLDSWNFRSIESLVKEQKNIPESEFPYFTPTTDENSRAAIVSMEVINVITPNKLLDGGAFSSEYIRVKPNWDNPYNDFLDTAQRLNKTKIRYNYKNDLSWETISTVPVKYFNANSSTTRITDTLYGYYDNPYFQASTPWWNYYDNYNKYENDDAIKIEPDRLDHNLWQSQFDFCELPGDYLNVINKKIKWNPKLIQSRMDYADSKRLKKQWDVYKKSVCCEREKPETFFAILTSAEKIYGGNGQTYTNLESGEQIRVIPDASGIWKYEWTEVEFWPTRDAAEIPNGSVYSIIEFEDNAFPFVFTIPKGFLIGVTPADPTYPDNRAYNLNEILNSRVPPEYEYDNQDGSTGAPYTVIMNPGITDALGLSGPKSDRTTITSYPSGFKMLPVGKFRLINGTCPVNWSDDGSGSGDFYYAGRIVQMFRIPQKSLSNIIGQTLPITEIVEDEQGNIDLVERDPITDMYVFDIENAHDGLCADC